MKGGSVDLCYVGRRFVVYGMSKPESALWKRSEIKELSNGR